MMAVENSAAWTYKVRAYKIFKGDIDTWSKAGSIGEGEGRILFNGVINHKFKVANFDSVIFTDF